MPPPHSYSPYTFTFTNYLKNAANTVTGNTYVSYDVIFTAAYIDKPSTVNYDAIQYDYQVIHVASATTLPKVVIVSKYPNDNTSYQITCTINATQCSRGAETDDCQQFPNGTGGYYAGIPSYAYQSFILQGVPFGQPSGTTITSFIQQSNVSCGCQVPH